MSDQLADRLRKLAEEEARGRQAEKDQQDFQQRVNTFISDHSRAEYERLLQLISQRATALNPMIGDLPAFNFSPGMRALQQGNAAAYTSFDKPVMNRPENALLLSFGPGPNVMYAFSAPPAPVRYRLQAAASDDLDHIVWVGNLGELTSEAEFVFERLTAYYLKNKPS